MIVLKPSKLTGGWRGFIFAKGVSDYYRSRRTGTPIEHQKRSLGDPQQKA
jgi:hypothetical protein